jgi:hypothetical protein
MVRVRQQDPPIQLELLVRKELARVLTVVSSEQQVKLKVDSRTEKVMSAEGIESRHKRSS